ncbi:MAG: hypothetical protein ACRDQA_10290 [Nocardioidaceae bacterium]
MTGRVAVASAAATGPRTVTALMAVVAWRAWTIHTAHTSLGQLDAQEN